MNDLHERVRTGNTLMPAYRAWHAMLTRCYYRKWCERFPTYAGCTVDPRWHRLSVFKAWFDVHYRPGFELDKDILVPGNKIYGHDTCVLVPKRINYVLLDSKAARGGQPIGVTKRPAGFAARCCDCNNKRVWRTFRTADEAADWYRATKSRVIRKVATDALVRREIDLRTHLALLRHAMLYETGQHQ